MGKKMYYILTAIIFIVSLVIVNALCHGIGNISYIFDYITGGARHYPLRIIAGKVYLAIDIAFILYLILMWILNKRIWYNTFNKVLICSILSFVMSLNLTMLVLLTRGMIILFIPIIGPIIITLFTSFIIIKWFKSNDRLHGKNIS